MRRCKTLCALAALTGVALAQPQTARRQVEAAPPPSQLQQWMQTLTLRDRVAQLIVMNVFGEAPATRSSDYRKFRHWVNDLHIGGLIVNNRVVNGAVRNAEPYAMTVFLNRMQRMARIPLIVGGDFERGASMRVANTTRFPYNMAFAAARDLEAVRFEGAETARQARALGVHWLYAPDADVNNNPDNPIINTRSFGEDPKLVAEYVAAYIQGAHSDPKSRVLVTVKHFPGHGDTAVDSHIGLARVDASRERLNSVELVPFKAAIENNVDAVMTAHLTLPAVEPEEIPSTISHKVITGLLREELGFKGIVVTDAMDMQGLSNQYASGEASVRALEAGVDVLLMPKDPDAAIQAVVQAVRSGRLTKKRIDQSVIKVLNAKLRVGLARQRLVDVNAVSDAIENPDADELAQRVADHAVTLVRNEMSQVPLRKPDQSCLFILAEGRYSQQGRVLMQEARARSKNIVIRVLDPTTSQADIDDVIKVGSNCESVVVAAFVTVSAYRGNVALPGSFPAMMAALTKARPVTLVAFGNPYLLRAFPDVTAYLATFSTVSNSEASVAKALFGEIGITGRMPVSIPGLAKIGDGIQLGLSGGSK